VLGSGDEWAFWSGHFYTDRLSRYPALAR